MRYLRQSTSVDLPIGPFLDSTDGSTAETALTITQPDIRLKKNGAAWAQKSAAQTLTHEENGHYEVTLDATDTNTLGFLRVAVAASGALPIWDDFMIMPANVWDSLFGADALQVHAVEIANDLITASAIAGNAVTEIQAGLSTLDAAGVRVAVGLGSANLDTQLSAIDTVVDAVKAKTDSLTFTQTGHVDANVQRVNDVSLTGDGSGTSWGPA